MSTLANSITRTLRANKFINYYHASIIYTHTHSRLDMKKQALCTQPIQPFLSYQKITNELLKKKKKSNMNKQVNVRYQ